MISNQKTCQKRWITQKGAFFCFLTFSTHIENALITQKWPTSFDMSKDTYIDHVLITQKRPIFFDMSKDTYIDHVLITQKRPIFFDMSKDTYNDHVLITQKRPIFFDKSWHVKRYGVATISRLLKIIGLFCRISSLFRDLFQKRPMISRSRLIVATPYLYWTCFDYLKVT